MQPLLHVDELLRLALEQPVDRNARPARDDGGDVVLVDLFLHHPLFGLPPVALGELALQLRQLAVADLRRAREVAGALGTFELHTERIDLLRDLLDAVERLLFLRPARLQFVAPFLCLRELAFDGLLDVLRLLRHRGELDLELAHPSLRLVELDG